MPVPPSQKQAGGEPGAGKEKPPEGHKVKKRRRFHLPHIPVSPQVTGALLGVIVAAAGILFLLHRPWLHFGHVKVVNARTITTEEVMEKAGLEEPLNIFNIDRSQLEALLREDVRVEKVSVSFGFPNLLKVDIKEREPGVYLECNDGYAKVSYSGHVLSVTRGIPDAEAPLVTGYRGGSLLQGDVLEDENLKGMLTFLNRLDTDLRNRIAEISLDDRMHITVHLEDGIPIVVGDYENALDKIGTFTMLCGKMESRKIKAKYIDLTYEKPYIKLK